MADTLNTMKIQPITDSVNAPTADAHSILMSVYGALQAKGYDPTTQLVGYLISGDPTYITSYQNARSLICHLERDEIMEELVRFYMQAHPRG